jgi:ubiquinone/menaquinone biosynthesis C-methylase UbiE
MEIPSTDLPKIEKFVHLSSKTLLEVGCGDGRITALLTGKTGAITAIDPDAASIDAARKDVSGAVFMVGSGEKLEFAADAFDIILFSYSLHHQDCVKALKEAGRVVKPDGNILIIEPTYDGEFTRLVSVFDRDEVSRIQKTLAYISSARFNILRQDTYCIDHLFADEHELYAHFITKYMTEKDDRAIEKIQAIIGIKKAKRPICIRDEVNIFLL